MINAKNSLDLIGNTPIVLLRGASEATGCEIWAKCEYANPGGSVKDRAALYIVRDAEANGLLRPGGTIVEGTAGNTGIGLALVGTLTAVLVNPLPGLITIWINLALATTFCTEAAGYLRSVLDRQIATDPLTGATTRAGLTRRIERELDRSTRTGEPVSAIIIDVDDFKSINDRDGHAVGDRFLVDLVATIRAHIRPYDTVPRLGGDEFLLLLPASDRASPVDVC